MEQLLMESPVPPTFIVLERMGICYKSLCCKAHCSKYMQIMKQGFYITNTYKVCVSI